MLLMSMPSFKPTLKLVNKNILSVLAKMPDSIAVGVGVFGPAAAYSLVWELGSKRLKKPGPKTMWGTNRFGQKRIFSTQAPAGYVSIHGKEMQQILEDAISKVKFDLKDMERSRLKLEVALDNAAQKIAKIVANSAPVDSGDLKAGIQSLDTDDTKLMKVMSNKATTFII